MTHHPQLTAHSQLTNLEPGQIHCLQLPPTASFLPIAPTPYLGSIPNFSIPSQTFFRSASFAQLQGLVGREGCLICAGVLSPRITRRNIGSPTDFFTKLCGLLAIPMEEIQHEWNINSKDDLPICSPCLDVICELIILKEDLEELKNRISNGIRNIREKIRQSASKSSITDLRIANFRTQALLQESSYYSTCNHPYSANASDQEISYVFNNTPANSANTNPASFTEIVIHEDSTLTSIPNFTSCQPPQESQNDSSTQTAQLASPSPIYESIELISANDQTYQDSNSEASLKERRTIIDAIFALPSELIRESTEVANVIAIDSNKIIDNQNPDSERIIEIPSTSEKSMHIEESLGIENPTRNPNNEQTNKDETSSSTILKKKTGSKRSSRNKNNLGRIQSRQAKSLSKQNSTRRFREHFTPVETDDDGNMTFEGIQIIPGENGYTCGKCGTTCGKHQNSAALWKVKIHIKGVHMGAYRCEICSKNFTSKDILIQHASRTHGQESVDCDICGRPVKPRYLINHKFTHMNAKEKENFISETGFKPLIQKQHPKYECKTCGKLFAKRFALNRHEIVHVRKDLRKSFTCSECPDKVYTSEQSLKEHKRLRHGSFGAKMAFCKYCDKFLPYKSIAKHIKIHTTTSKKDRQFVCKICKKRLCSQKSLTLHEADHQTEESPSLYKFECEVCGQRFLTLKSRNNHTRKAHHKKVADVPKEHEKDGTDDVDQSKDSTASDLPCKFKCLSCDKIFENFEHLDLHDCSNRKKLSHSRKSKGLKSNKNLFEGEIKRSVKLKRGYILEYIMPDDDDDDDNDGGSI